LYGTEWYTSAAVFRNSPDPFYGSIVPEYIASTNTWFQIDCYFG